MGTSLLTAIKFWEHKGKEMLIKRELSGICKYFYYSDVWLVGMKTLTKKSLEKSSLTNIAPNIPIAL